MSLPIIETPMYTTTLPYEGTEIRYRPFLVGEQKTLMIAQESGDTKNMTKEIFRLLEACTEGCEIKKLHTSDLEFLFVKLRIVSVGETSEIGLACEKCNEDNNVVVNYEEHEILQPEKKVNSYQNLTDTLAIELRLPTIIELSEINQKYGSDDEEDMENPKIMFAIINKMVEKVINGDEVMTREDFTDEELDKFLESMTLDMLEKILEYIKNQPKLVIPTEFKCSHCGHENKMLIEGMENFFV